MSKSFNQRMRLVFYADMDNPNSEIEIIPWPLSRPMPRDPDSLIIGVGEDFMATGKDENGRNYVDYLRTSEFSGQAFWVPKDEDPYKHYKKPDNRDILSFEALDDLDDLWDKHLGDAA